MAALNICFQTLEICLLLLVLLFTMTDTWYRAPVVDAAINIIKSCYRKADVIEYIKQDNANTPAYEVGYMVHVIFEKYRRMIDKYNVSKIKHNWMFEAEHILFLEEIETHYWEIEHLTNMLHEVERKYNLSTRLDEIYFDRTSKEIRAAMSKAVHKPLSTLEPPKKKGFDLKKYVANRLHSTAKNVTPRWWWPLEYGWEIDYYW